MTLIDLLDRRAGAVARARHLVANPDPSHSAAQRRLFWLVAKSARGHPPRQARLNADTRPAGPGGAA